MITKEEQEFRKKLLEKTVAEKDTQSETKLEFNVNWDCPHQNKTFYFYRNEAKNQGDPEYHCLIDSTRE